MGELREGGMRRSGDGESGERELPIENYGKKEQKPWLVNSVTAPDPNPCTAGNKEEDHILSLCILCSKIYIFGNSLGNCHFDCKVPLLPIAIIYLYLQVIHGRTPIIARTPLVPCWLYVLVKYLALYKTGT